MNQLTYVNVDEATNILTNVIGADSWLNLDDSIKNASLNQATFLIDSNFNWHGSIASNIQELRWPRKDVLDSDGRQISSEEIPYAVKYATALLALHLTQSGGIKTVPANVRSLKVGPISISMDSNESISIQTIPKTIISTLNEFGDYKGLSDGSSAYNIKVTR